LVNFEVRPLLPIAEEHRNQLSMASPSPNAEAHRHRVSPLHAAHTSHYSLHSGTARTPGVSAIATKPTRPPAHPGDVAQSRLFQAILNDELDELDDLVAAAERRWMRQRERNPENSFGEPHELQRLRERTREARRLLDALDKRFPSD
jgi:hypothetical protein